MCTPVQDVRFNSSPGGPVCMQDFAAGDTLAQSAN